MDAGLGDAAFVAGDWGTTNLRLYLCDANGLARDSTHGAGVAQIDGRFAEILDSLIARWTDHLGSLPTILCGMVGSNMGWAPVPYVTCPATPASIADKCVAIRAGSIHLVPGLACINPYQAPDYLRGEETQILGALTLDAALRDGHRLLCLPGTHTKWVLLEDGEVREFLTAPTGEIYALIRDHSVLVRRNGKVDEATDDQHFNAGLSHFNDVPDAQLLHRLFECRGRQLAGEFTASAADAYLSGLLVASDVRGGLLALSRANRSLPVYVIGSPELTRLYARALTANHCGVRSLDGAAASRAGMAFIHRRLLRAVHP